MSINRLLYMTIGEYLNEPFYILFGSLLARQFLNIII